MVLVMREDPDRTRYTSDEMKAALKAKRENETLLCALKRLEREGKIDRHALAPAPKKRILSASGVRGLLKGRRVMVGEGFLEALERAVATLVEVSITNARSNTRKKLVGADVTGESVRWALALRRR